ncbi:hypothetical protein SLS62_008402 [Diatrype stigma]|uniref:DUF7907 domain-containing protein n=1 Tax=Diatrype stigma TaxID=117547 RepID=A0AAN9UJI4_9PEZI
MLNMNALTTLGLVGLASAVPLSSRNIIPNYPKTVQSQGFQLIVNVTDPAHDLTPSVNGWAFDAIHVGAAMNDAVITDDVARGRVFYQNGTAEQIHYGGGSILSDAGTPPAPYGVQVASKDVAAAHNGEAGVTVNVGGGTPGVLLTRFPEPESYLRAPAIGTYAICPRNEPYYNKVYNVLRWTYDTFNNETALYESTVPDDCVAVTLLPQAADLPELPEGSISSHEFAVTSSVYEDVKSIDWTQYGP